MVEVKALILFHDNPSGGRIVWIQELEYPLNDDDRETAEGIRQLILVGAAVTVPAWLRVESR